MLGQEEGSAAAVDHDRAGYLSMSSRQLRRGNLSWLHVGILSVAFMGPAASVMLNTPLAARVSFTALPLAFLLSLAAVLLNVNTVNVFASRYPSSGSFYAYSAATLGPRFGFLSGWMLVFAYFLFAVGGFCAFALLASEFMSGRYGLHVPYALPLLLSIVFVIPLSALGIREVLQTGLLFLTFEIIVLLALAATIFAAQHSLVLPAVADAGAALTYWPSTGQAMLFAVLCFLGFESGLVLGEEVKDPLHAVPKGVFWASVVAGVLLVVVTLAGVVGFSAMPGLRYPGASPYWYLAGEYWGPDWVYVLQVITLISILAFVLAAVNALARVVFAMARDWKRLDFLARSHRVAGTPLTALAAVGLAVVVGSLLSMVAIPVSDVWTVLGETAAIAMLLVYLTANIALMRQWLRREPQHDRLVGHLVLPGLAAILLFVPLASSLPRRLAPLSELLAPGVVLAWLLLGLSCYEVRRWRNPIEALRLGRLPGLVHVSLDDVLAEGSLSPPIPKATHRPQRSYDIGAEHEINQRWED